MVLSVTIQYAFIVGISIVFSAFAMTLEEERLPLKAVAGFCWFVTALIHFILNLPGDAIVYAMTFMYFGFGMMFCVSSVMDFFGKKKDRIWEFMRD